MEIMRSFFYKTPTTSKISTRPVFTGHGIPPDLVRLMATFLEVEDINALGRTNRTWRRTIYSNIHSLNLNYEKLPLHPPSMQERMKIHFKIFLHNPPPSPPCRWYAWPLQNFTALQSLSISHIRDDASFAFIGRLTTLQRLIVRECHITDNGLTALRDLKALKHLKLDAVRGYMTYAGVAQLWPIPFKKLTLTGFHPRSQSAEVLTCLTTLKLTFCHCMITDVGELRRIIRLQNLKFKCCLGITFDDINNFHKFSALQLDQQYLKKYFPDVELNNLNQIKEWSAKRRWREEPSFVLQWCDLYFTRQS